MGRARTVVVVLAVLLAVTGCARDDVRAAVVDHYAGSRVQGVRITELTDDTAAALVDVDRPGDLTDRPWGEYVHLRREAGHWIVTGVDVAT